MQTENNATRGGIGFFGILQIVFITLKVCGIITWGWVKVFIPLWIWLGITILFVIIYLAVWLYEEQK